jgi:tripartite ATP-independent transporter DctP family solute receptor
MRFVDRIVKASALGLATALALACGGALAQQKIIRAGHSDPADTPHGQSLQVFKKVVEANSKGSIQVQLFPSLQLGPVIEQMEGVKQGTQEMFISTPAWFSRFYNQVDVLSLPYLVTDWDAAERMMTSDVVRKLAADAEAASGIKIIGVLPVGFRNAATRVRAITKVEDFAGLKIRVQNSPVYLNAFRALKANPVALDAGEMYQAVQSGVVDGIESTFPIINSAKFFQVAPFISETRHNFDVFLVYLNKRFYEGLSADQRKAVDDAIRATEAASVVITRNAEAQALRALQAAGVKYNEVSKETLAALQRSVKPVYDEMGPKFEPNLTALRAAIAGK